MPCSPMLLLIAFQAAGSPTIICYDSDAKFLNYFHAILGISLLLALVLYIWFVLFPGWVSTRPYLRIALSSIPILILGLLFVVATLSFLHWPALLNYISISPEYPKCIGANFDAQGFLGGLLGSGVSAISQPLVMLEIVLGMCALYILLLTLGNLILIRWLSPWRLRILATL